MLWSYGGLWAETRLKKKISAATVYLMVAVEVVKAFEDATEPSNPHSIDIHHTSVAKVVNIRSYPASICQLL